MRLEVFTEVKIHIVVFWVNLDIVSVIKYARKHRAAPWVFTKVSKKHTTSISFLED
jgi:hypothetical protein